MRWFAVVVALLTWSSADSAHALRCGTYLIHTGNSRAEVRARCGEPVDVALRVEENTVHRSTARSRVRSQSQVRPRNRRRAIVSRSVAVEVETWTLNFGPQRFMVRLEFRNGFLARIETLGRGFRPDQLGTRTRNVQLGQSPSVVRATWGEPTDISVAVLQDAVTTAGFDGAATATRTVEVETWLFNFGPNRFMRRVTFEDGRVVRVETLGRGF